MATTRARRPAGRAARALPPGRGQGVPPPAGAPARGDLASHPGGAARRARPRPAPRRWVAWAAAAAALLAVGVGIGRLARTAAARAGAGRQLGSRGRDATGERDRVPARHGRASRPVGGVPDALPRLGPDRRAGAAGLGDRAPAAGDQPAAARFPGGEDRRTRLLLEDLELVLAEIAQLAADAARRTTAP